MEITCAWCLKPYYVKIKRTARFCTVLCRMEYHNHKRRAPASGAPGTFPTEMSLRERMEAVISGRMDEVEVPEAQANREVQEHQ